MKRLFVLISVSVLTFLLAACGKGDEASVIGNVTDSAKAADVIAVNDVEPAPVTSYATVKVPCAEDLEELSLEPNIVIPEDDEFLSSYENMFIFPSVTSVFSNPRTDKGIDLTSLHAGDTVTVAAKREKLGFVTYDDTDGNRKAGWISLSSLSYNNPLEKNEPTSAPFMNGTPSQSDIDSLGQTKSIALPLENEYLPEYDRMFVVISSAEVLAKLDSKVACTECTLSSGSEVTLLALRDNVACILFESDSGTKAGWILLNSLGYNNPLDEVDPTCCEITSGTPGINDITGLGLEKSMTLPDEDSYVSAYDKMYVQTSMANLLSFTDKERAHIACCLASGSEVSVIAKQNSMICVLCETDQGTKCGWIMNSALGYNMPNQKGRVTAAPDFTGKPGIGTLEELGLDNSMMLPEDYEYASGFNKMRIGSNLTNVLSYTDAKMSHTVCNLYPGSEVTVLAHRDKIVCVAFNCDSGTKAGWVSQESLTYCDINSVQSPTVAQLPSGTPGIGDIEKLGLDNSMTLPEQGSYLTEYEKMYVSPPSVQIYSYYGGNNNMQVCTLLRNSIVIKIAEQEKSACILFESDEGLKAGWLNKELLSSTEIK